jgi:TetR/AcrR family transcriptional repressor of nem operon
MVKVMGRKEESHQRILAAAGRRFRADGLDGAALAAIMGEAGLTHGGFYAHFAGKEALIAAALETALAEGWRRWLAGLEGLAPEDALRLIVGRYLSPAHRDAPTTGCAMAALASELARRPAPSRLALEAALLALLESLERSMPEGTSLGHRERAIATTALCLGGLLLSRMVVDPALSDAILLACRRAARTTLPSEAVGLSLAARSR